MAPLVAPFYHYSLLHIHSKLNPILFSGAYSQLNVDWIAALLPKYINILPFSHFWCINFFTEEERMILCTIFGNTLEVGLILRFLQIASVKWKNIWHKEIQILDTCYSFSSQSRYHL